MATLYATEKADTLRKMTSRASLQQPLLSLDSNEGPTMAMNRIPTDYMELSQDPTRPDMPELDDTSYWGPIDDNFRQFLDMDWSMMAEEEVMHWAI